MKDPRVKEPKSRPHKLKAQAPQRSNIAKTSKKTWKEKKKNNYRNKRDCCAQESSTLATEVNISNADNSKKKKNGFNRRNPSEVVR